eukprot:357077_1
MSTIQHFYVLFLFFELSRSQGWTLVWHDEFDGIAGNAPNATRWKTTRWTNGGELQRYVSDYAYLDGNGKLVIKTKYEPHTYDGKSYEYKSGIITSMETFNHLYGKYEIIAKLPDPSYTRLYSSIWLQKKKQFGPCYQQITIMNHWTGRTAQSVLNRVTGAYHFNPTDDISSCNGGLSNTTVYEYPYSETQTQRPSDITCSSNHYYCGTRYWNNSFSNWTLVWDNTSVSWYIDGYKIGYIDENTPVRIANTTENNINTMPYQPMYIIINTAVCNKIYCQESHYNSLITDTNKIAYMYIDSVRVFDRFVYVSEMDLNDTRPSNTTFHFDSEYETLTDGFEPLFIIGVIGISSLIIIFICLCVIIRCILPKNDRQDYQQINNGEHISNALAVVITIAHYDHSYNVTNINPDPELENAFLQDIPVEKDSESLKKLFDVLNYTVIPCKNKFNWTEKEIITYLKEDVVKELFSDDNNLKYDGLIVCLSCHGEENKIITSDYCAIEKSVIHRIISINKPMVREIPRIFIYDSCEGSSERIYYRQSTIGTTDIETVDKGKGVSLNQISTGTEWTHSTKNPDYKLAQIHASNPGFQAKCNSLFGSYLIFEFVQKMMNNVENNINEPLITICEEIQNKLHDSGKQQIYFIFNNNTSNLHLIKNSSPTVLDTNVQMTVFDDNMLHLDAEIPLQGKSKSDGYTTVSDFHEMKPL